MLVVAETCVCSTRTGLTRTVYTSTTRSFSSTPATRPYVTSQFTNVEFMTADENARSAATRGSTGSRSPCTSVARLVALPASARRYALYTFTELNRSLTAPLEPRLGQGSFAQPYSGLVYLEEAQHAQPPPLPVKCCTCFVMHSVFSTTISLHTHVSHACYGCMPSCTSPKSYSHLTAVLF